MDKIYTTTQGDTWDIIALKMYAREAYTHVLIEANPENNQTVIFSAGVELLIPNIIIPSYSNLPPWKR